MCYSLTVCTLVTERGLSLFESKTRGGEEQWGLEKLCRKAQVGEEGCRGWLQYGTGSRPLSFRSFMNGGALCSFLLMLLIPQSLLIQLKLSFAQLRISTAQR